MKLTTEGIKNIGRIASSTESMDKKRKLALVVYSSFAFGMARMYEAYRSFSSKSNKEVRVFRNRDDAFNWLNQKALDEPGA